MIRGRSSSEATAPDVQGNERSLFTLVLNLFQHVSPRRRYQFALLLMLTILGAAAEAVSLGAIVPFIGILTQPDKVFHAPFLARLIRTFGFTAPGQLLLPLTLAFAIAAIVTGVLRLALLWIGIRLANLTGTDLSVDAYRRTLYQPYSAHIARSSSEIISGITQKVASVTVMLMSLTTVVTSAILFSAILLTLLTINASVAGIAFIIFGTGYTAVAWFTRKKLVTNSECIAREQTTVVKALQEGLGAIRDVLLDGTQEVYCDAYGLAVRKLQLAAGENTYINQAPRFAMETLGMVLVAGLAYSIGGQPGNMGAALPVLGALGLGAQRLLPLLQQLYGHWSLVAGSRAALADVLILLEQPIPADADETDITPLGVRQDISFDGVRFRYSGTGPLILDGVSLDIPKGTRVGIVGATGSGKSTMLDLLMALLRPTGGRILVDGRPISGELRRPWQRSIAHVPQHIYLADSTIAENIAFGVPSHDIDHARVRRAATQAQLADFIEARPNGYHAVVGERGVRLSGGQRQRIGIARALYKQASVLVFDEATSALDGETETAVMTAIETLDRELTIFVVAHRITTLQHCDMIVELAHGNVVAQDSYEDFIQKSPLVPTTART